jgi:hypothetical protein
MTRRRPLSYVEIGLGAVTLTVILLVLYAAAYLGLGEYYPLGTYAFRMYPHPWQVALFRPAGWVESQLGPMKIYVLDDDTPVSVH